VKVNITGDENTILVTDQMPKYGIALDEKSTIYLYTTENNEKVMTEVPNIKGLSISNAKQALKEKNLNIKIEGKNGVVISQDPSFGTQLEEGTAVNVVVKENLDAGY
jgi:beta-lactam-binding protein with PASTA domain